MRFSFHNFGKRNGILHLFNTGQSFTPLPNYKKIILSSVHCRETSWRPQQNIPSDLSESVFANFHDKNIVFCNCVKQVKNELVHIRLCTLSNCWLSSKALPKLDDFRRKKAEYVGGSFLSGKTPTSQ